MRSTPAVILFYLTFVSGSKRQPHASNVVQQIRSKLGFKCLFNLIKPIYFLYMKENAIQHHHCTSWSSFSVTMTTNSISPGISIAVKFRLFYPVCSIQAFFSQKEEHSRIKLFYSCDKRKHKHNTRQHLKELDALWSQHHLVIFAALTAWLCR